MTYGPDQMDQGFYRPGFFKVIYTEDQLLSHISMYLLIKSIKSSFLQRVLKIIYQGTKGSEIQQNPVYPG